MQRDLLIVSIALSITAVVANAAEFYVDPVDGSPEGDGSEARPWQTIESVLSQSAINDSMKASAAWMTCPSFTDRPRVVPNIIRATRPVSFVFVSPSSR